MSHSWSDINKKKATSTKTTNLRQWPPVVFASCHKHLAVSTILTIVSHEVIQKLKIKLFVLIFVFMTSFADAVKSLCREGTFVLALEILEDLCPKRHRCWRTSPIQSCVCPLCLTAPSSATVSTFETMKSFQVQQNQLVCFQLVSHDPHFGNLLLMKQCHCAEKDHLCAEFEDQIIFEQWDISVWNDFTHCSSSCH